MARAQQLHRVGQHVEVFFRRETAAIQQQPRVGRQLQLAHQLAPPCRVGGAWGEDAAVDAQQLVQPHAARPTTAAPASSRCWAPAPGRSVRTARPGSAGPAVPPNGRGASVPPVRHRPAAPPAPAGCCGRRPPPARPGGGRRPASTRPACRGRRPRRCRAALVRSGAPRRRGSRPAGSRRWPAARCRRRRCHPAPRRAVPAACGASRRAAARRSWHPACGARRRSGSRTSTRRADAAHAPRQAGARGGWRYRRAWRASGKAHARHAACQQPAMPVAARKSSSAAVGAAAAAIAEAAATAKSAGLRYVDDSAPGISRLPHRTQGFSYRDAHGTPLRDADAVQRIRKLAIPPAWTDVWICPQPRRPPAGHRPRRQGPQAVPLPRAVARRPRPEQVRPPAPVRPGAAGHSPPRAGRAGAGRRADAQRGAGHAGAAARHHLPAHRQRRIRARQRLVRAQHAAQPPRRGQRHAAASELRRQERRAPRRDAGRPPRGTACVRRCQRTAGAGAVPVSRRRRHGAPHRFR